MHRYFLFSLIFLSAGCATQPDRAAQMQREVDDMILLHILMR